MLDSLLIKHGFGKCLSAIPTKHSQKMHWLDDHKNHIHQLTWVSLLLLILSDLITHDRHIQIPDINLRWSFL